MEQKRQKDTILGLLRRRLYLYNKLVERGVLRNSIDNEGKQ